MVNFFELFEIDQSLPVDLATLRKKYFNLQKENHPDNTNTPRVAIELINQGYQILCGKVSSVAHLLEIRGIEKQQINNDVDFLMQAMHWQEQLSTANRTKQGEIIVQIEILEKELIAKAISEISQDKLTNAARLIEKAAYLQNMQLKATEKNL